MKYCIPIKYKGFSFSRSTAFSPDDISELVSNVMGISILEMQSNTRKRPVVEARQIAMYLIRKHTDITLKETGGLFGGRDHSTVLYACRTVEDLRETNKVFKSVISKLNRKIYEN